MLDTILYNLAYDPVGKNGLTILNIVEGWEVDDLIEDDFNYGKALDKVLTSFREEDLLQDPDEVMFEVPYTSNLPKDSLFLTGMLTRARMKGRSSNILPSSSPDLRATSPLRMPRRLFSSGSALVSSDEEGEVHADSDMEIDTDDGKE